MKELIAKLATMYMAALKTGGYSAVVAFMALESSIFPLPSEIVIPPAAHLANTTGQFSYWGIILAGTIGSWIGAAAMYWASRWAGRPLVLRYGKYFFVPEEKVHAAERWAKNYGSFGVFIARLLPVVRHLIGIPMGIVKMDFKLYSLFTIIGSAIWCSVLCYLGVKVGEHIDHGNMRQVTLWIVGAVAVLVVVYYFFVHRHMKNSPSKAI